MSGTGFVTPYLTLRYLVRSGFIDSNRVAPTLSVNSKRLADETATDSSAVIHCRIDGETRLCRLLVPVPPQTKALRKRWNEQVRNSTDCSIKAFARLRHKRSMESGSSQFGEHGPAEIAGRDDARQHSRIGANSSLTGRPWCRDFYEDPRRIT